MEHHRGRLGGRRRGLAPVAFRLSDDEHAGVQLAADVTGVTKSEFSRRATLAAAGMGPGAPALRRATGQPKPEVRVEYDPVEVEEHDDDGKLEA